MHLKARLETGSIVYGLFCSTPAALSVEIIAAAGYDFVVIDLEHTLISTEQLAAMLLAARASDIAALVRVASPHQILQTLDAGAEGIVFPHIRSVQEAQNAVRLCHFSPLGERGLNATSHTRYGRDDLVRFTSVAQKCTLVVAMIENREGIENVDEIAAVEGIDVLLAGAADLSQSVGLPWQTHHPDVRKKVLLVRAAAERHNKIFCGLPRIPGDFESDYRSLVRMFILGDDRGITRRAMASHLVQHQAKVLEQ